MSSGDSAVAAQPATGPATTTAFADVRRHRHWSRILLKNRTAVFGAGLVMLFTLIALLAPVIAPSDPLELNVRNKLAPPSRDFPLGTDQFGRDVLSRVVYGARLSLGVGLTVGVAAMVLGLVVGLASGYFRRLDSVLMRVMDAMMAFPSIIFAIVLMGVLGPSIRNVIIALTLVFGPRIARVARSTVLVARQEIYVEAARASGSSDTRIIARHILPNIVSPLITQASYIFALAVLAEAALSFVGVGGAPDIPSWGNMLSEGQLVARQAWWISVFPGLAIVCVVFGANLLGDGLRDALDPRLRKL
jgi:peptide/nickel transport system permease protein